MGAADAATAAADGIGIAPNRLEYIVDALDIAGNGCSDKVDGGGGGGKGKGKGKGKGNSNSNGGGARAVSAEGKDVHADAAAIAGALRDGEPEVLEQLGTALESRVILERASMAHLQQVEDAKNIIIASARQRLVATSDDLYGTCGALSVAAGASASPPLPLPRAQPPLAELLGLNSPWGHSSSSNQSSGSGSGGGSNRTRNGKAKSASAAKHEGRGVGGLTSTAAEGRPHLVLSDVLHQAVGGGLQWIVAARITNHGRRPVAACVSLASSADMVGAALESVCFGGDGGSIAAGATTTLRAVATVTVDQIPVGNVPTRISATLHCHILPQLVGTVGTASTAPSATAAATYTAAATTEATAIATVENHNYHLGWYTFTNEMMLTGKAVRLQTAATPTAAIPSAAWCDAEATPSRVSKNIPLCGHSASLTATAASGSASDSVERALSLLRFSQLDQQQQQPPPQQQGGGIAENTVVWVGGISAPALLKGAVFTLSSDVKEPLRCTLHIYADKQQQVVAALAAVGARVEHGVAFAQNNTPSLSTMLYNTAAEFAQMRAAAAATVDARLGDEGVTAASVMQACKAISVVQSTITPF